MKTISLITTLSLLLLYSCSLHKIRANNNKTSVVNSSDTTFLFETSLYNGHYKFYIQSLEIHKNSLITKTDKNGDTYMVDSVNRTYFTADNLILKEIQKLFYILPPKRISFAGHNYMIRIYKNNTFYNEYLINSTQNYIAFNGQVYYFDGKSIDMIAPKIIEQDTIRLIEQRIY